MAEPAVYETASRADFYKMVQKEADTGDVILLDSQLPDHPSSGKSYLFAGFDAIFRWNQHVETSVDNADGSSKPEEKHVKNPNGNSPKDAEKNTLNASRTDSGTAQKDPHGDPWLELQRFRERFPGYCCGYLGYDLKNAREQLISENADPIGLPDMWMGRPTRIYILNEGDVSSEDFLIQEARPFNMENLVAADNASTYKQKVERAQKYITEGDIYEVNISHQLKANFTGEPFSLFIHMAQRGPVPFASYLKLEDVHACCASPERFLTKKGEAIYSDPIKGTRPRGNSPEEDEEIVRELSSSEKEKAENLMIVDLVRNDFSRVCTSGSVKVSNLFEIQHFSTVHQMVSRVEGTLQKDVTSEEVLAACFPMGSMTGAPKIRSIQIIEELEDYKRGLYSGAIGVITPDGDFNFNVVIRTAIIRDEKLYYSTGGAITADSDPLAEWEETLIKSRALGTALRD